MVLSFEGEVKGDSLGALKVQEPTEDWYRTIWVPVEDTTKYPKGSVVNVLGELDHIGSDSFTVKNAIVNIA